MRKFLESSALSASLYLFLMLLKISAWKIVELVSFITILWKNAFLALNFALIVQVEIFYSDKIKFKFSSELVL
jgi:hypothetical protein